MTATCVDTYAQGAEFARIFFFTGGLAGALGFNHVGYIATVPLALTLMLLVIVPVFDDLSGFLQNRKNQGDA